MRLRQLALLFLILVPRCLSADDKLQERPRYVLHVGDTIELAYRLSPEFNQTVTLQPDGRADLNIAGETLLAGLTLQKAKEQILQLVSVRLNAPELSLTLKDFQKPYVMVGGEVVNPGKIEIRQDLTAFQAVLLAGGTKSTARSDKVLLFRHIDQDTGRVRVLDLSRMNKTASLERDMRLEAGDMIYVPTSRLEKFSQIMRAANFGLFLNPLNF